MNSTQPKTVVKKIDPTRPMDPTYVHLCIKVMPKLCKSVISGVYSAGIYTVHARKWNALASFESVREKPACWLSIGGATEWIRDLQLAIQYHSVVQPFYRMPVKSLQIR